MPVQVLALNEKKRKPPERQVATNEVSFMGRSDREVCCPSHFEQGYRLLPLQRRIFDGQQLPASRLLIEQ